MVINNHHHSENEETSTHSLSLPLSLAAGAREAAAVVLAPPGYRSPPPLPRLFYHPFIFSKIFRAPLLVRYRKLFLKNKRCFTLSHRCLITSLWLFLPSMLAGDRGQWALRVGALRHFAQCLLSRRGGGRRGALPNNCMYSFDVFF